MLIYEGKLQDTIVWSIKEAHFPNEDIISREQIFKFLKNALHEFRWTGYEDVYINGFANVTFNF